MKTFKQFILEGSEPNIIELIKRDCSKFLKESKLKRFFKESLLQPVYRGLEPPTYQVTKLAASTDDENIHWFEGTVRTDRKPLSTKQEHHEIVDNLLKQQFGWNVRSAGLFCSGSIDTAGFYGKVHMIFPIGDYEFVWSKKYSDLYGEVMAVYNLDIEEAERLINALIANGKYTNRNLVEAIKSKHEISFKCDRYYAVRNTDISAEFFGALEK